MPDILLSLQTVLAHVDSDPLIITIRHHVGFTAQRIIENCCSNPSLARKESHVFGRTQVIIIFKRLLQGGVRAWVWRPERDCSTETGESFRRCEQQNRLGAGEVWASRQRWAQLWKGKKSLLASIFIYLLNVYLHSALSVGLLRDS